MSLRLSRGRTFVAVLAATLLLAAVAPAQAAATLNIYHWMANIQGGGDRWGDQHNNYYNQMILNPGGAQLYRTGLREYTFCCGWVWEKTSLGSIWYSHPTTYYAFPTCRNREPFSFWVDSCSQEW